VWVFRELVLVLNPKKSSKGSTAHKQGSYDAEQKKRGEKSDLQEKGNWLEGNPRPHIQTSCGSARGKKPGRQKSNWEKATEKQKKRTQTNSTTKEPTAKKRGTQLGKHKLQKKADQHKFQDQTKSISESMPRCNELKGLPCHEAKILHTTVLTDSLRDGIPKKRRKRVCKGRTIHHRDCKKKNRTKN